MSKRDITPEEEVNVQDIMQKIRGGIEKKRNLGQYPMRSILHKQKTYPLSPARETGFWKIIRGIDVILQKTPLHYLIYRLEPIFVKAFYPTKYEKGISIVELMRYDDADFINNAYTLILKRPPDEKGFYYYLNRLRSGQSDKIEVIKWLRFSEEGKKNKVYVKGLSSRVPLEALYELPVVGYVIEMFVDMLMLPQRFKHMQRLEALITVKSIEIENKLNQTREVLNEKPDVRTYRKMKKLLDKLSDDIPDSIYLSLEDKFRGSREEIKSRAQAYLPYIWQAKADTDNALVLDVGCGRGEWLELLKENNFTAQGVDTNKTMVVKCRKLNLDVVHSDAVTYLTKQKSNTLGAITGFHIVEHLSMKYIIRLLGESLRVLKKGGVIILETPNPQNLIVGASNFYTDPTHKKPIPPDTLIFLLEIVGFKKIEEKRKVFDKVVLQDKVVEDFYNSSINIAPDYAVIARKE